MANPKKSPAQPSLNSFSLGERHVMAMLGILDRKVMRQLRQVLLKDTDWALVKTCARLTRCDAEKSRDTPGFRLSRVQKFACSRGIFPNPN